MNENKCTSCGEAPKKCSCKNKEFTKAVIEIDNPEQITLMRRVVIPASMGDDTTVPPAVGKYKNVLLYYEANKKSYLYSSDGIPTQLVNGLTNYEEATNLPQINGVTLIGDKSSADLKLADAPMVITVAAGNTSWSGADTAEDVYNFFLNKGKVNVVFNGGENYAYEIDSAGYIPEEEKIMCTLTVATATTVGDTIEFDGNAMLGIMTLYTADKAIDVGQIELQPKLFITDFTGLNLNYNELSGVPATNAAIGMVKPGDGLEVANDGTLSISDIEQYAHSFDTVADLKASTDLVNGDYARTIGYYSVNDRGGAIYKISSTVPNGYYETLSSGLYAELIVLPVACVNQFGAYGDGTHDDSDAINYALSSGASTITFVNGSTYMVRGYNTGDPEGASLSDLSGQHGLMIPDNTIVDLNFATIKCITNDRKNYNIFSINDVSNVVLKNGKIIGDVGTHTGSTGEWGYGVSLKKATNVTLDNLYISLCWGDGINLQVYSATGDLCKDIYINNVTCYDNRRQGMSIECGDNIIVTNSKFNKTGTTAHTNPSAGVDIEPATGNSVRNVKFYGCEFNENYGDGFECMGDVAYVELDNCKLVDNQANTSAGIMFINQCTDVMVRNCELINTLTGSSNFKTVPIYLKDNFYFIDNRLDNVILLLRRSTTTDKKIVIKGCEFNIGVEVPYNKVIEMTNAPDTLTTLNGCELIIDNCKFVNTSNDKTLNISGWVDAGGGVKNRLSLMKVTNCYFYCGLYAVMARYTNSIIKNNNIVMSKSFPIVISQADYLHTIDNNIIEETSWANNTAGILFNDNATNLVLTNNKYFKRTLNTEIGEASPQYSPNRWLQGNTPTGIDEEHENYIVNNV